jgi:predicted tellurium resistance membrane protein TerC
MIYLVQLIVMALDPIIFLIVLTLNFISLDKKKIIIYGIIGGLIAEIMVASMNVLHC